YTRHGNIKALDLDAHAKTVGVDDAFGIDHDCDMTLPEDKIAAPQRREIKRLRQALAQCRLLHVRIAQGGNAGAFERTLHEPRTIESHAVASAPEIWHAQMFLGYAHIIAHGSTDGCKMRGEDPAATLYLTEIAARAIDPDLGIEGKRRRGPAFQIGVRIDEGAERGNDVGWLAGAGPERLCIDITDIIIMSGLAPGPAALFLVNAENLTDKQSRVHGRIGLGAMQQRGAWHLDLPVLA